MPLETATHIASLVATNPAGSDDLSTADDHIRLIKQTLLTDLPLTTPATAAGISVLTAATVNAGADVLGAFRRGTVLGAVSQTAGVPTGALFETITNANGVAKRYADGTQICFGTFPDYAIGANLIGSPAARSFASAFDVSTPIIHYSFLLSVSADFFGCVSEAINSFTQCQPSFRNGATAQSVVQIRYVAIGRWF